MVEISKVMRSVENAIGMLETLGQRRLSEIVITQLESRAMGQDGMHVLQVCVSVVMQDATDLFGPIHRDIQSIHEHLSAHE